MLLVLILLAVVGGIMALLLKETLAIERSQAEGFDKLLHHNALADQFRTDVAQALDAPTAWQEHHADERTLILQMPGAGHVVYRWNDGQLKRRAFEKQTVAERLLPVDGSDVDVKFVRPTANPKLIGLRLHVARKGSPLPGQTLEIVAALAGEWR